MQLARDPQPVDSTTGIQSPSVGSRARHLIPCVLWSPVIHIKNAHLTPCQAGGPALRQSDKVSVFAALMFWKVADHPHLK